MAEDARPEQLTPEGEWLVWLLLAGRGFGKTRTAAEDVAGYGLDNPESLIAVVAETFSDARDVCIEGESGLLSCLPDSSVALWNRSIGELFLTNATKYKIFSGDKPDGTRGYQHHRAWVDELAKFRYARETWTQLQLGMRLGDNPQTIVTTTPKPVALIRDLMGRENVHVTRGSTFDNAANLAAPFLQEIRERYEGTRVGQQELHGVYLEEYEGALWTREMVERSKTRTLPDMRRLVVAVDPAVSNAEESDETGIVVAGVGVDGRGYVLRSEGVRMGPDGWARRAVDLYHEYEADRIVAEKNQGGDMVRSVLGTVDRHVPIRLVHASKGKRTRAEPVAALFEQGKVGMLVGPDHTKLEDQMCTYTGAPGEDSPDVLDAAVWALTDLMDLGKRRTSVRVTRRDPRLR